MIFYFTGTGNSLYVAKKLQKVDGGKLIDMAQALKDKNFNYKVNNGEKVGIVFPVYFWGLPTIVSEFISQLKLIRVKNPFIYTVMTYAEHVGKTDRYLAKILESKNLELNSSYSVKMPDNYILLFTYDFTKDNNYSKNNVKNQIKAIIKDIKNNKQGFFADHGPFAVFSFFVYWTYGILRKTKKFQVGENCISCGQCEKICPSQVIMMRDGEPKWVGSKCSHCTSCINRCPSKAIEYGNSTKKRERYVNPNVKLS